MKRLLFAALLVAVPSWAKPGNEQIIKQKMLTTRLYVGAVAVLEQEVTGIGLLWVPASAEAACVGKSAQACSTLKGKRGEVPSQTLSVWLNDRSILKDSQKTLEAFTKLSTKNTKQKAGLMGSEIHLDQIEKKYSVNAEVQWELWSNGENFTVLKILP